MEDRYEIRGKIGQGGLGSVYRAFDKKMSREVAIKRITTGSEEGLAEESKRQLLKEAGSLASLQHPHIVTVHDFGSDEDGPFVVMELIAGKTLDDVIAHAPLTWIDFRELALQTQEALIAAQDLDLVHGDLKPSNLMLNWLPSGKFQVKVVDFGLAVLTQSQCSKEIEAMDAVFGSIFFMPPEQFERKLLNSRSDMYSIGCVYYQALTCQYPFNGHTANDVMEAHLQHDVIPLHELREDIPQWVCDWVMWHINRYAQDRPESAREALALFLQNDRVPNPPMSRGRSLIEEPKRPKLIIPTGTPPEASTIPSVPEPTLTIPTPAVAYPSLPPAIVSPATSETVSDRPQLVIPATVPPIQDPIPQAPLAPPLQPVATNPTPAPIPVPIPVPAATPAPVAVASLTPTPLDAAALLSAPTPIPTPHAATPPPTPLPPPQEPFPPSPIASAVPIATPPPASATPLPFSAPAPIQIAPATPAPAPVPLPVVTPAAVMAPTPVPTTPTPAPAPVPIPVPASAIPVQVPAPAAEAAPTPAFIPQPIATAVAAAAAEILPVPQQTPNAQPADTDGSEPPKTSTSHTRTYSRPKLVLNKHTPEDLKKSSAYSLATGTSLHPTIPTSTSTHAGLPTPITTPQSIPRAPTAPAATPAAQQAGLPTPVTTPQSIPRAPTSPINSPASSPTTPHVAAPVASATPVATPAPPPAATPAHTTQAVSPQPLQPPAGSKPSIHQSTSDTALVTSPDATPRPAPKTQALATASNKASRVVSVTPTKVSTTTADSSTIPKRKRGVSTAIKGMIATVLTILILIVSWVLVERMGSNREAETLNNLITQAAQPNTTELPVTRKDLDILLGSASNVSFNKHRSAIYKALLLAKSSDGTDIDGTIATFVTGREMLADVKETLIKDVLRMRNNPAVVPTLLTYAGTTTDPKSAAWSLKAIRFMAEDRHFDSLLRILQNNSNVEVRSAAEETMTEIIRKSSAKDKLADSLSLQYTTAINHEIRHCLLRLMGVCGGEKALLTVRAILVGSDQQQIIAALIALGSWGDHTGFPVLVDFLKESRDPDMRRRAFDSAQKYLGQLRDNVNEEQQWNMLSNQAKTREEQMKILQGIANVDGEWPLKLVQTYTKSDDDEVAKKAERALDYMQDRQKLNN